MAARYRVKAPMIVVPVPGSTGGETYMHRGALLPDGVDAVVLKRFSGLGLIEKVAKAGPTAAEAKAAADKAAAAQAAADAKAKAEAGKPDAGTKGAGK